MVKMIFVATLIIVLLIIFYLEKNVPEKFEETKTTPQKPPEEASWNDILVKKSVDPDVVDSHAKYIANTRQFSSGANFASVADDNNSGVFTNFLGFSRPKFVAIDPTARQVPDVDMEVLKRNKHLRWD